MGNREEAGVERYHQRRESARLGGENRPLLQEGFKAGVGKGLGGREPWPWVGLKSLQQVTLRLDRNEPVSALRRSSSRLREHLV